MSPDELLQGAGIYQWDAISDTFDGCDIFIGNGFSINMCQRLSYRELFDLFRKKCIPELTELFKACGTTNFELIMEVLNNARRVNELLKIDNSKVEPLIDSLRSSLIQTIVDTHPGYREISPEIFRSLSVEFNAFNNIITTNYDVFLYKIILAFNDLVERGLVSGKLYQDSFWEEIDEHKLGVGVGYEDRRNIFYLHGSLFIFNRPRTYKYRKGTESDEYIRILRQEIEHDNIPLFVSEGNSDDKLRTIQDNYYLSTCANYLRRRKDDLVVYGSSFSPPDRHIVGWINESKIKSIAYSIYIGNKTLPQLKDEISRINNQFGNISIAFFDSSSLFKFHPYYRF